MRLAIFQLRHAGYDEAASSDTFRRYPLRPLLAPPTMSHRDEFA